MSAELYNDWYISARSSDVGPSSGGATSYQKHNVDKIYAVLNGLGWTKNAISAVLGNMQIESWLNPADATPTIGNTIASIGNSTASDHPDNAYGLLQWKGRGSVDPDNNQLVGYAIRYGYQWYDGDIQMQRLTWEYNEPAKFHPQTVDGVYYTFASFASSTSNPDVLAKAWMVCYEGTYSKLTERKNNALFWYDYLGGSPEPPTPEDWISGYDFSSLATAYDPDITGVPIPYSQWDCITYVNHVWKDIPVVSQHGYSLPNGTNTLWRRNMTGYPSQTYNTTSPDNQNPTPVLWWKGTVSDCVSQYGDIPAGALLFHQISEAGPPAIPPEYAGDGIGNFAHVGIYIGNNQVMQSGGRDSGSVPGGGVHRSAYDDSAWNYVAFVCYVGPSDDPGPGPEPPPELPPWLLWWYTKKKEVLKNVRKTV